MTTVVDEKKMTRVVNSRSETYGVYIGRRKEAFHFGNPFTSGTSVITSLTVPTRYDSIKACYDWLAGTDHYTVEPRRRQWVLEKIESLRGETLGCFCKPKACHGDVFRVLLGEIGLEEALGPKPKTAPDLPQISLF